MLYRNQNIINELKIKLQLLQNEISKVHKDSYSFSYDIIIQARLCCEYECGIKNPLTKKAKIIDEIECKIYELEGINPPVYWRVRKMAMESFIKQGVFKTSRQIKRAAEFLTFIQMKLKASEFQDNFINELSNSTNSKNNFLPCEIIESTISSGENSSVEFKSTLRWNIKEQKFDDEISYSVIKTIAAFLNTKGGILLIGVEDNGNILGIEKDNFRNNDTFIQYLSELIKNSIEKDLCVLIEAEVIEYNQRNVCLVKCSKSSRPVYCNFKKKNEELFVRNGPTTIKLALREVHNFIVNNF